MPATVEIEGVGVVEFPDSMTQDDIAKESERLYSLNKQRIDKGDRLRVEMQAERAKGETIEKVATAIANTEAVVFGLAHPIKNAERAVEITASTVARQPLALQVKPSEILETPVATIPQIPQQEGAAKQIAAGSVNAVIDFANFFLTPEGVATLGIGALPRAAQKSLIAAFATSMAVDAPQQVQQAAEAYRAGDIQAASKHAMAGGTEALLSGVMARHALSKPTVSEIRADAGDQPPKAILEDAAKVAEVSDLPATAEAIRKTEGMEPAVTLEPIATPEAPGITPSPAVTAIVRPLAEPSFWRKWFTAAGNLPKPVHDAWLKSRGEIAAEGKQIEFAVRDLYQVLQKEHGIGTLDKLKRGMQDVPKEKVQLMDEALKGDMAAMGDLSPEVRTTITTMREHVDRLSKTLIDRGLIDEQLAMRVDENLGTYLTRSYRIFDDPKWVENIPAPVREDFVRLLESDLGNRAAAEVKAREMLQDWSESGVIKEFQRGKLGRKDLTQFMKRKDLTPEVRAVLGEYKDPVLNYARSVTKIARFIGDQQFLNEVRTKGLNEFLFEEGQSKPGFESQIAAEESAVMSPLNGLRTSPAIREAFEKWQRSKPSENILARAYFALNALSKGSKTIGSLLTQVRNLLGQPFFNLMSGHWDFTEYGKSLKAIAADIGVTNDAKWRDYYTHLRRLNLVDESAPAGELRDVMRDAGLKDQDFAGFSGEGWARAIRKVGIEAPIKAYRISDELGKIVGFENEKAFQKKLNPEATPEQIELLAAERIRNTYPTYSMLPESVRQFRKQPLVGPFVSFAYEALRTSYHSMRYAVQDSKVNPGIGAQRIAGIATVLGSGAGLTALGRYLFGVEDRQLDDLRRFLPPWAKNSQVIPIGKEDDGSISYINYSYANPYSYLIDTFIAALADDAKFDDRFIAAAGEFLRPFSNEQMLASAIQDVSRNQTAQGREIYNPQDTDDEKIKKILGRLFESIEPGSITRLRKRIVPSLTDKQPDFGRKLEPSIEIASELTGVRAEKFNFGQGFQFKARRFREDEQNAEYIFSKTIQRTGSVPDNEVAEAYRTSEQQRFQLWVELYRDAQAAMGNGVKRQQIVTDLRDSGLSAVDRGVLMRGEYRPKTISTELRLRARQANRDLPQDEIRKIQEEFRSKRLE